MKLKSSARRLRRVLVLAVLLALSTVSLAKAGNGSVTYAYDALGRLISANYDNGVLIYYKYDANGNRTQQVINVNTTTGTWGSFVWGQALWGP
jgi:YD repeat-containing protein